MAPPDSSPHVLHVSVPTTEGVARCVADLAAAEVEAGWRVTVASPDSGDLPGWVRSAGGAHATWRARRDPGLDSLTTEVWRLRHVVAATAPDVVHLHAAKAGLCGRLLIRGRVPTLYQPHSWPMAAVHGIVAPPTLWWERRAGRRYTSVVVCVSEGERAVGVRAGIDAEMVVIPNAVDVGRFPAAGDAERAAARAALGLRDVPTVVQVGRLCEQKAQDVTLSAWPQVRRSVPDAALVFVGDGPDRAALERTSGGDPSVSFAGSRTDVAVWLAAADVVAMPSRWEGMSLALLEAMATGRSVVASDAPGNPEVLDGTGAVVPVDDPAALARALVDRLADPDLATAEGSSAAARVRERFTRDRWRERNLALLRHVLAGDEVPAR